MHAPTSAGNLASMLARTARCWPRLPSLAIGDRVLRDYETFARRAASLAGALQSMEVQAGERVAIVSRNLPEYLEALFACWWAGLTAVPVNAKLHANELAYILADSGTRLAFVDAAWHTTLGGQPGNATGALRTIELRSAEYERMTGAPPRAEPAPCSIDDPAWLFYTSGTTGRPKGVVISHGNLMAMSQCFLSDVESICPGDAIVHAAPLSHGSGLYSVPHVLAGAVHVLPETESFDAAETLRLAARWNRSCLFAAPTMVKRIVASHAHSPVPLDRLKSIIYGGGPMYVADCKAAFAALGPRLAQIYGQGESPMTITAMRRELLADAIARGDDARIGSVGIAQTGIEVIVADADDAPLPAGTAGEILVRGATVMRGYWMNPEATAATLANDWLHTGDIGAFDADGFLTLIDRSKDLIISGGSNIYPREVEEILLTHPDVVEAAVVGRAHAEWGEEVVACVVARGGIPVGGAKSRCSARSTRCASIGSPASSARRPTRSSRSCRRTMPARC